MWLLAYAASSTKLQVFQCLNRLSSCPANAWMNEIMWDKYHSSTFDKSEPVYEHTSVQVPETARIALDAIEGGMCVVIGLQSTGEANTVAVKELIGDSMDDFVSAPQQILLGWLNNHFPKGHCGMADAKIYSLYSQVSKYHFKNLLFICCIASRLAV